MTKSNPARWVYQTRAWKALRKQRLQVNPLCFYCAQMGRVTAADTVDHIVPHRGDRDLAFDFDNTQSLCKSCHDVHAQAKDRGLPVAGCDADGYPLDTTHHFNKE